MERLRRDELRRHMIALAAGDRQAFHPVFVTLWPLLRAFASRQLPPADAEDAAQEALIRVMGRATQYDASRDVLPWALTITAFEVRTLRRRRHRRRERTPVPGEIESRSQPGRSPEQEAADRDIERALEAALLELSEQDRETMRAYATGERPDLPGATFRKRVERGLARLRAAWREKHGVR